MKTNRVARSLAGIAWIAALFALAIPSAFADEWAGSVTVQRIRVNGGTAYVGVTPQPPQTCSNWGEHLVFDATTPQGKNWLAIFMTAKVASRAVDVWFTSSSAPGTNQSTGCGGTAISVLQGVSLD